MLFKQTSIPKKLMKEPIVKDAFLYIQQDDEKTLKEHLTLCEIPAPSLYETERSRAFLQLMKETSLQNIHQDEVGNVFGTYVGKGKGPHLLISAHLDTVFDFDTDVKVRQEEGTYYAPGIGDDTRGLAEVLSLARTITALQIPTVGSVTFCANVAEEGLGDLKGIKHIFKDKVPYDGFMSIDGGDIGGTLRAATGSHRYEVAFRGTGGHSFGDFGIPNPIHAMGRAIQKISNIKPPKTPLTTYSVSIVKGGTSINSIPHEAIMMIDMRSGSDKALREIDDLIQQGIQDGLMEENAFHTKGEPLTVTVTQVGNRPAGALSMEHPLAVMSYESSEAMGEKAFFIHQGSTDCNVPLALGIPAICVGKGGKGGGAHTPKEWYRHEKAYIGVQKHMLTLLSLIGIKGISSPALPILDQEGTK